MHLHERHRARGPRRADQRDGHFIRNVEGIDQHLLAFLQVDGVAGQESGELS